MTRDPVDYVDPMIDTAKPRIRWVFSVGTARPAGMVRLAANTDPVGTWNSGYRYRSASITCFSHLHSWQLSGVPIMPTTGDHLEPYVSRFRHETETHQPGYYSVLLEDTQIRAELTATTRVGFHRYHFPRSSDRHIVLDLAAELGPSKMSDARFRMTGRSSFSGYVENDVTSRRNRRIRVYFAGVVNCDVIETRPDADTPLAEASQPVILSLERADRPVLVKIAISFTSEEGAEANLAAELPHWDFDAVRAESREEWNRVLSRIVVEGGLESDRVKLYTDLFRVLSAPQTMSDVDGRYCHTSDGTPRILETATDEAGRPLHPQICGHDGFWNSQWSTNTLLGLGWLDLYRDMCRFLVDFSRDGGLIPRGPAAGSYTFVMISAPTTPFLVGAWMKGVRGFDIEEAFAGMVRNSLPGGLMSKSGYEHDSSEGGGIEYYLDRGYIPAGRKVPRTIHVDGAAQTLEYAYQDWALSELARALGKHEEASRYFRRSQNYRNLFDRSTGFMRPRTIDGEWLSDFDPLSLEDFCEANSWQYSFHVMQDLPDLISLMGGERSFVSNLDEAFRRAESMHFYAPKPALERDKAYVNYGNEPGRYVAHLFSYAGAPWLTQKWAREVKRKTFGAVTPTGFCEDDDIGKAAATSALLALGLFDTRGGVSQASCYELTAPVFERITFDLGPYGQPTSSFTIEIEGNPAEHPYIRKVELNGDPLNRLWISHREFTQGGTLRLTVGAEPETSLGVSLESRFRFD